METRSRILLTLRLTRTIRKRQQDLVNQGKMEKVGPIVPEFSTTPISPKQKAAGKKAAGKKTKGSVSAPNVATRT